jgi:predicted RNA-binding protein with RPS1 domain
VLLRKFIERTRMVDLEVFPQADLDRFLQALEKGATLASLEKEYNEMLSTVPFTHLRRLSGAVRSWKRRQKAMEKLKETVAASRLPAIPQSAADKAMVPHKIWALGRALRMCPRDAFDGETDWAHALEAHIDAWSGAVNLALRRGELRCMLDTDHPRAADFEAYARRREHLSDLATHRWLAIRRGEKNGALTVTFNWPRTNINSMVESIRARMGPPAQNRELEALAEELVWNDLTKTIRSMLDRRVEQEAVRCAVSLYTDLLNSPPLCDPPVGVVSVGRKNGRLGAAVVNADGGLIHGQVLDGGDGVVTQVLETFSEQSIESVVLPSTAPDKATLSALRKNLTGHYDVVTVRSAALREARLLVQKEDDAPAKELATALVLARRALDPSAEWAKIDPVAIGLAEYQNDLDQECLRDNMLEALGLHRLEQKRQGSRTPAAPRKIKRPKRVARAKLRPNPLVRSISDLRAGMTVNGIVSNITRFGVFVNLGLEEEGMIHISELSAQFVSSPEQVVSLGQHVTARVLEVDPAKKRVALTLKKDRPIQTRPDNGPRLLDANARSNMRSGLRSGPRSGLRSGPRSGLRSGMRSGPHSGRSGDERKSRSEALQQLEDLFKKG